MAGNTIMKAKNSFSEGLIMDFAPDNTQANCLTSALNATLLTFNGNEMSLLNDMGNGRVETAYLPDGYVPVGTCEFGDIIYIVSYNPIIDKALIGCFPSPERNISSEELGQNPIKVSTSEFLELNEQGIPTGNLKASSVRKIVFNNDMHPGDQYIIYSEAINAEDPKSWGKYVSDYGNTSHTINNFPKFVKINIVSIEDTGKITYLNSNVKWYDNDYYLLDNFKKSEGKIDLDSYRTMTSSAYSTFASKVSGKLALLIELEKITGFNCSWECYLPKETYYGWLYAGKKDIVEYLDGTQRSPSLLYNNYLNGRLNQWCWTLKSVPSVKDNTANLTGSDLIIDGIVPDKKHKGTIKNVLLKDTNYIVKNTEVTRLNPLLHFTYAIPKGSIASQYADSWEILNNYIILLESTCKLFVDSGLIINGYNLYVPVYTTQDSSEGGPDVSGSIKIEYNNHIFYVPSGFIRYFYEYRDKHIFNESYITKEGSSCDCYLTDVETPYYFSENFSNLDTQFLYRPESLPSYEVITETKYPVKYTCLLTEDDSIYVYTDKHYILENNTVNNNGVTFKNYNIIFNFNWETENKNINPKYAILEDLLWESNRYNYYVNNNGTLKEMSGSFLRPTKSHFEFSRVYEPENYINSYESFIKLDCYEKKAESNLNEIKKLMNCNSLITIKNNQDINSGIPVAGSYYFNVVSYEDGKFYTINNLEKLLLNPYLVSDDIINNTFKYPIKKELGSIELPVKGTIDNYVYDIDRSKQVLKYKIIPAMPYGKLEEFAVTGSIDFSKIGETNIKLKKWKYYNYDDLTILTWEMDAYTEPDKGIPEVVFEFYDNQGLAAAYHILNYSSYNGLFTNYLNLNGTNATPNLNNIDWKGEEFFHLKNDIKISDIVLEGIYYYYDKETKTYIKINNLEFYDETKTNKINIFEHDFKTNCYLKLNDETYILINNRNFKLYESDAGTLYSNWLYGVKIIVRYEYKNIIGDYIKNENPIIDYRWLWTNGVFNEHYYTTDDFTNLLFSLNLDMDVNYSTTEDWYLLQEDYCNPEVTNDPTLSGDSLLGATIQYINCDRTKNNVKLKVTPGLLETYNTFTLCSEKQDHNNTTIYPLKEIFAEVILADQTLNNYPELPNGKQYSYGIQESDYIKLTPYSASVLTGSPLSEDGKLYGKILGSKVGIPSEENDLFSGASTEYFKNNFSLYNESYINYERFKDKNDNYEDINLSTYLDFSDYSIAIPSISRRLLAGDSPIIIQPSQRVEGEFTGGTIHTILQKTLYRYVSIKTGTTVNNLNEILNNAITNIDIDLDLSKSVISAGGYNFYKSSSSAYDEIANDGGTIYKLGRTYSHNKATGVKSGSTTYDVPAEFYETVTAYIDISEGTVNDTIDKYEFMYIQDLGVYTYGHLCESEGAKETYSLNTNNLLLNTLFTPGSDTSTNIQVPNWNCKFKNYYTTQGESITKAYPLYNNEKKSVMYCEYINKGTLEAGFKEDSNYGDVLYLLLKLNSNQWYTLSYSIIAEVINNQGEIINIPDNWYEENLGTKGLTVASYIYPNVATSNAYTGSNESGTYKNAESTITNDCAHFSKLPINGWVDYTTTFKTIDNLDNSDKSVLFRIWGPTKDTDYYDEVYKIRILITNISLICHGEVETNITLFPERQIKIGENYEKCIEDSISMFNSYYKINTTISNTNIYNVNTDKMTFADGLYTFTTTDKTPAKAITYNPIQASYTKIDDKNITLYLSICDKISPKYFLDNGISKFITKGNKYVIECDLNNVSVYFAYRDDFGSLFGEEDYLSLSCYKYYINKSHTASDFEESCLNKLKIININNGTGSFEAPRTGDVIFIIKSTEPCNLSVYKETESFKLQPLEYYDSNGILKSVDSYYSYLFESNKHNLDELMNNGLDLALSGIHFSKYLLSTEEAEIENNIIRPYVYFEKDLKYNNLCIDANYPGFKYILFFSMDNVSGENSKLMTSFHEISGYKSNSYSSDISINAPIKKNYYDSGSDGNISYTKLNDKKEWMDKHYCLFYPVGWGTLRDKDGTRYTSFKRGNTSVSLQGVAGARDSISGTTTLGIVTYNSNNAHQYVLFADDWRSKGIRDHAGDVMNFLTQTYFLTDDVIKVRYGKIKNYAYLYDNYCVYTRDILVKLHTNSSNQNNMITLRNLDFLQYIDIVKLNMDSTNLNDNNVTVNLDSVMKVVPIGFKFNYIMPLVKLGGDAPDKGYCVFKVTNPPEKPYDIIYGLSISKNLPYCLSGLIFEPLSSISLIDNIKNLKFKSTVNQTSEYNDKNRIQAYTIENEKGLPNGKMLIHSLNKNVKHYSNTVEEQISDNTVEEHTYYKLLPTDVRSASNTWKLLSTKNVGMWGGTKDYLYITDLPCDTTKENEFKYFD